MLDRDDGIDPYLLELEKAWKPLGHVKQDKYLGIGDRFEENQADVPRTPPDDKLKGRKVDTLDIALLDKQRKHKKELAAKRKKDKKEKNDQVEAMVASEMAKQNKDLNSDMLDILNPDGSIPSPGRKKKKTKRA